MKSFVHFSNLKDILYLNVVDLSWIKAYLIFDKKLQKIVFIDILILLRCQTHGLFFIFLQQIFL